MNQYIVLLLEVEGQGPTTIPDSGKGTSTEQEERLECSHYHKYHYGSCGRIIGGCFLCGSTGHLIVNVRKDLELLEILKEVAEKDLMYLHQLVIGVEGEVVQSSIEEVLHQK